MIDASRPDTVMLCGGAVRLLLRRLPDPLVCAYLPDLGDGVLRIVVDPSKPDVMAHVLLMLRDECDDPISLEQLASWCRSGLNYPLLRSLGLANPPTR